MFCGLDVGRDAHHVTALDADRRRLLDRVLPNSEPALRQVFSELLFPGSAVVVVDAPASIGARPIAVAQSMGLRVAYLPGLALRRIADLHPGEGKTDARDAYVIADACHICCAGSTGRRTTRPVCRCSPVTTLTWRRSPPG